MNIILFSLFFLFSLFISIKDMRKYENIFCKYKYYLILSSIILLIISAIFFNNTMTPTQMIVIALYPIGLSHFIIDLIDNELPDISNLVIAVFGIINLIFLYLEGYTSVKEISTYIYSGVILFCIYFLLAIITGGQMGGGDIKLIGGLGLFIPLRKILSLTVLPFFIGGVFATVLLIKYYLIDKRKHKEKPKTMPFGPSIIIAFIILIFS